MLHKLAEACHHVILHFFATCAIAYLQKGWGTGEVWLGQATEQQYKASLLFHCQHAFVPLQVDPMHKPMLPSRGTMSRLCGKLRKPGIFGKYGRGVKVHGEVPCYASDLLLF